MVGLSALPLGSATATEGIACASVHSLSFVLESSRARMPVATISPAPIKAATPNRPSFRRETGGPASGGLRDLPCCGGLWALFFFVPHLAPRDQTPRGARGDEPHPAP